MPKLVVPNLELQVIRTLSSAPSQKQVATLLSSIDDSCFYSNAGKQCFARIKALMRERGELVSWSELQVDPVLNENIREKLARFDKKPIKLEKTHRAIDVLHKYRRARALVMMANHVNKTITQKSVDVDSLMDYCNKTLADATSRKGNMSQWFIHIGGKSKADIRAVKKLLKQDDRRFLPTGFEAFDRRNHGIPRGALWLICGSTGAGKSILAGQVARNMARKGAKVCVVPLEMKNEEMLQRELARTTDVDMSLIICPKTISKLEKQRILNKYRKFRYGIKQAGGLLSLFSPEEDMTAEETLYALKNWDYDIIIFDYIGLLKGVDGDDQWRALRNVTRFSKRYASINDMVVSFCAQLSDEGAIRYAKGMIEDASNAWYFVADARTRETGILPVDQKKARNQEMFRFLLHINYQKMLVRDLNDDEKAEAEKRKTEKQGKKGKEQTTFKKVKPSKTTEDNDFFESDD